MQLLPVKTNERTVHTHRKALQFAMNNTGFHQMRVNQLIFLLLIAEKPGITQVELSQKDHLNCSRAAVTRNIDVFGCGNVRGLPDRHKFAGFVEAVLDERDNRYKRLYLTKKGESFLEAYLGWYDLQDGSVRNAEEVA